MGRSLWFWADTGLTPKFLWIFDYRTVAPVILWITSLEKIWILGLALLMMIVLSYLSWKGYTMPVFLRRIRRWLANDKVEARPDYLYNS